MTESDPLDLLRRVCAASGRAVDEPTAACLDDDTVAALAEGSLDAQARAAALAHLAQCGRCTGAVASVVRLLADAAVSRALARADGRGRRRFFYVALPLAAAAVLLIVAPPRRAIETGTVHRAPTITAGAVPVPGWPVGVVAAPGSLRWSTVPGADRYRVTLFDATSRVVYERTVSDTEAVLPDSVRLVPGQSYLWKVDARTGYDRWAGSSLVEFRVAGTP